MHALASRRRGDALGHGLLAHERENPPPAARAAVATKPRRRPGTTTFPRLAFTRAAGWLALVSSLLVLAPTARANIVNIEAKRPSLENERENGASGSLSLDLSFNAGNINTLTVGANGTFNYIHDRHSVYTLADYRLAAKTDPKSGGTLSELGDADSRFLHRALGHLRYGYEFIEKLYGEAYVQLSADQIILLRSRLLLGLGPRLTVYDDQYFGAFLGLAYYAERENLAAEDLISQPTGEGHLNWWHRVSSYLTLRLRPTEQLLLTSVTYVQPRVDFLPDLYVLNENVLELALTKRLSLKLTMSIRFDSAPPTYCIVDPEDRPGGECPAESSYTIRAVDIGVTNALTVNF